MTAGELVVKRIYDCARCGRFHEELTFKALTQPFAPADVTDLKWTHWAPCPTNSDPILLMVTK